MKNLRRYEMVERVQEAMNLMVAHSYEVTKTSHFQHLHELVKEANKYKSPLRKVDLMEIAEYLKENLA